ncbi:AP-3 complex subunit delta, partial [Fragariocoptes setiger]
MVKTNLDRLFDKNLTDLVRGIRNNKDNEAAYIAQSIEEIKEELKMPNINAKANAVAKLTYLQMIGYDISWAAFNIIEVMSSNKFTHKRIGYLASSQCFRLNTDVLMLTINMIRRDLCSRNMYEAGCAMSGLSCFMSSDLGRELFNDVIKLLSSTKPYLRKKAILLIYKILINFPDALPEVLPKLEEKLDDPDQGVQSSAVNVICELARKEPRKYLHLEGTFYKLMENSSNNWMLIKVIKLFGALTPLEPKIGEKLIDPLVTLVHSTSATSVLYECISTIMVVLIALSDSMPKPRAAGHRQLCAQKLRVLIEDPDQNLKYLGLLAMRKILQTHPKSVRAHQDIIFSCLEDKDESIRLRALDLLCGMVSKDNILSLVDRLMKNITTPHMGAAFRNEIVLKVIDICSREDYKYISDFDWYVTVLVTLAGIEGGTCHGNIITQQLLDVAVRVERVRPYATKQMAAILNHVDKFMTSFSVTEVLYAAAWICGEYSEFLDDKKSTMFFLLGALSFSSNILAVFIHNACKLFSRVAAERPDDLNEICDRLLIIELPRIFTVDDLEVQERATNFSKIIELTRTNDIDFTKMLYAYELKPVTSETQLKVPIPTHLNIDEPFETMSTNDENEDDDDEVENSTGFNLMNDGDTVSSRQVNAIIDFDEPMRSLGIAPATVRTSLIRDESLHNDIHYLRGDMSGKPVVDEHRETINNIQYVEQAVDAMELNDVPVRQVKSKKEQQPFKGIPGLASYSDFVKKNEVIQPPPIKAPTTKKVVKKVIVKKKVPKKANTQVDS